MDRQSIGCYQIVGELGRGAMGTVYHGFDPAIGRPVAIKVLRLAAEMSPDETAQLRQRLIREASAAGKLSHPNLVTVYQLGEEGTEVFIAMEYVKGTSLRQEMQREGGIPQERCVELLRQIADGLDCAHRAGIVHRDIKPDNILIREDGCAKVADFGIAKVILETATQQMTSLGASVGSPMYMSPEQIKAEGVDAKSDQFSLAVVGFEMLTGRRPFSADSMAALMYQITAVDPMATEPARRHLPERMKPAFARAMAKNPAERFPTCGEFVKAIMAPAPELHATTTMTNAPRLSTPPLTPVPPVVSVAAKKSPVPMLAAGTVLLVVLGGVGYWASHRGSGSSGTSGSESSDAKKEVPLVKAIAEGRVEDAKKLLDGGADVNAANPDGTTALMQAAEGSGYLPNNLPAVELVLGKNPKLEAEDGRGRTALHRAVGEGKDEATRVLIEHKADPNHKASDGSTPLFAAVTYGKMPGMKALLAAGANVDTADNRGMTPLMQAAEGSGYMPNNAPFVQALLEKGAKVEPLDKQGRSALFLASSEGKTDAVNLLLDAKADANQKDSNGSTPLLMAVTYGKTETVKTLLKRGAAVDAADSAGNTPLMAAAEGSAYIPNNGPLVQLLLEAGAKVELQDGRGRTAFYRAASEGREDAMRLLLDHKAEINQRPTEGMTPLMGAVSNAKLAGAKLLVERGADVNLADPHGRTPLMIAAEGGAGLPNSADYAALLLSKGAKKDAVDDRGRTALALATEAKNNAVIELLNKAK